MSKVKIVVLFWMQIFILALKKSQNGVCIINENGPAYLRCCQGFRMVAFSDSCEACPNGTFGQNCEDICPPGYYGYQCSAQCNCRKNEICQREIGCLNKDCPNGIFGAFCDEKCPNNFHGPGCIYRCNCQDSQSCDRFKGCVDRANDSGTDVKMHILVALCSVIIIILLSFIGWRHTKKACIRKSTDSSGNMVVQESPDIQTEDESQNDNAYQEDPTIPHDLLCSYSYERESSIYNIINEDEMINLVEQKLIPPYAIVNKRNKETVLHVQSEINQTSLAEVYNKPIERDTEERPCCTTDLLRKITPEYHPRLSKESSAYCSIDENKILPYVSDIEQPCINFRDGKSKVFYRHLPHPLTLQANTPTMLPPLFNIRDPKTGNKEGTTTLEDKREWELTVERPYSLAKDFDNEPFWKRSKNTSPFLETGNIPSSVFDDTDDIHNRNVNVKTGLEQPPLNNPTTSSVNSHPNKNISIITSFIKEEFIETAPLEENREKQQSTLLSEHASCEVANNQWVFKTSDIDVSRFVKEQESKQQTVVKSDGDDGDEIYSLKENKNQDLQGVYEALDKSDNDDYYCIM